MGNANKSINYFEQAYACMLEHNDQKNLPNIINNLASLYAISGKKKPADMLLQLLNNPELQTNDNVKATVYLNLGSYYFRNNNPSNAEKYFLKSDSLFQKINKTSNPEILHSLGSISASKGDYNRAILYFNKVKSAFPNYNQTKLLNHDLAKTYFSLKQYDKAKDYYEESLTQNEIDNKAAIATALTKAQENLNFIKKESEIKELKLEKELLQSDKIRIRNAIISLVIAIILMLLLGLIYFRGYLISRKDSHRLLKLCKSQRIC
jgi:tetratricopeptide (TPR) repeat protein